MARGVELRQPALENRHRSHARVLRRKPPMMFGCGPTCARIRRRPVTPEHDMRRALGWILICKPAPGAAGETV
jgi:hypothetical protein